MLIQKNNREWVKIIMIGVLVTVSLLMIMPNLAFAQCSPGTKLVGEGDSAVCVPMTPSEAQAQAKADAQANQGSGSGGTGGTGGATAPATTTAPSNDAEYMKLMEELGKALILVSEFLQRLIWPILLMIGGLLKNDILFAAGMEETMLAIWRNIRNIVNILFILVLLGIAFYNVVGGSSQDYHIKTILPKFVIALIAVNFSFLAVKVVVDGVSVVTTAIFALPSAISKELTTTGNKDLSESEEFITGFCNGFYLDNGKYTPPDKDGLCKPGDVRSLSDKGKQFFSTFDSNNAAIVLAINMGKVAEVNKVVLKDPAHAVKSLLINVLFSTMLYIVYSVAFVAMLIVLAVRLVVLWVTMVLSPLIVLKYVIPESLKSSLGGADELGKKFVQNAIAPIPIALVMSIGFIMLQSWKQARFSSFEVQTLDVNLLTSGMSTLQDLIGAVAMVVVIWVGVFEASKGTYAESIVGGLKTAVEGAGKFVAAAPFKYMPIIPVGSSGDKVSVSTVVGGLSQLPGMLEQRGRAKETEFLEQTLGIKTDDSVRKAYDKSESGTDVAANVLRFKDRRDPDTQKGIGKKLKDNPAYANDFFRYLKPEYTGADGKKYKRKEIIDGFQAGTLPKDVFDMIAADFGKNKTVSDRASQLAGEAAKAPATAPAPGAAAPAAGAAAGTAAGPAPGQQPSAPATDPTMVADKAMQDGAQKEAFAKNDATATAARDKISEDLQRLETIVTGGQGDIGSRVTGIQQELNEDLKASYPDDAARAAKVREIMVPIVAKRGDKNLTAAVTGNPPPAPPAQQPGAAQPPAQTPPGQPPAGPPAGQAPLPTQ